MANPDLFYLSVDDYRDQTMVPSVVQRYEDAQLTSAILETMLAIDSYIGQGWYKLVINQEFIFPREQDKDPTGVPLIPRGVAIATRIITDAALQKAKTGDLSHELVSESNLGHSYTKRAIPEAERGFNYWPETVYPLLDQYRRTGGQLAVPEEYYFPGTHNY